MKSVQKLLPMVRNRFKQLLNGYLQTKELKDLDTFIVAQSLDDKQGIMGLFNPLPIPQVCSPSAEPFTSVSNPTGTFNSVKGNARIQAT